jgi:hypothetical protein
MSGRSRRNSTVASSKATEALQRQRDEGVELLSSSDAVELQNGDAKARKKHGEGTGKAAPKRKKRRRNRGQGWSRPAKRGVTTARYVILRKPRTSRPRRSSKKRARCTFAAGLETFPNQPCTSSYGGFLDGEDLDCSREAISLSAVEGRTCGKLAWLRPRCTSSIWERIARNQRDAALRASKPDSDKSENSVDIVPEQVVAESTSTVESHREESQGGSGFRPYCVQPNGNTSPSVVPGMPAADHRDTDGYAIASAASKEVMLRPTVVVPVPNLIPLPVGIVTPQVGLQGATLAQLSGTSQNANSGAGISGEVSGPRQSSWPPGVVDLTKVVSPGKVNVVPVNQTTTMGTNVGDAKSSRGQRGRISILSLC